MANTLTNLTLQFSQDDNESLRTMKLNRLASQVSLTVAAINATASVAASSSSGVQFGPPTGLVGPTATVGSASTAMRSDAAPAINQGAQYTWSVTHTWNLGPLGGQQVPAIALVNNSAATTTRSQFSPLLRWSSQGWSGSNTQARDFVAGVRPTGMSGMVWALSASIGGAGYVDAMVIDQGGNITEATWTANTIAAAYGGTGQDDYNPGDLLVGNSTSGLNILHGNTSTARQFLISQGTGVAAQAPAWGPLQPSDISGNSFIAALSGLWSISWGQLQGIPPAFRTITSLSGNDISLRPQQNFIPAGQIGLQVQDNAPLNRADIILCTGGSTNFPAFVSY